MRVIIGETLKGLCCQKICNKMACALNIIVRSIVIIRIVLNLKIEIKHFSTSIDSDASANKNSNKRNKTVMFNKKI